MELYLHPGDVRATREEGVSLGTLVGSCVAICVWAPGYGGGMNHYVMPYAGPSERYGPQAIAALFSAVAAPHALLRAKVFGGASPGGRSPLGAQNAQLAFDELGRLGIPVIASDVGGARGRRILFDPRSGEAWVRVV